jgi:hypothetical protein
MRSSISSRLVAAALLAVLWYAPASAAQPPQAVHAVWVSRKLRFTYQGLTSRYNCHGLQVAISHLLTRLGARKLRVGGCPLENQIIPFPSVRVTMQVLVPATRGKGGSFVSAHWRKVRLFPSTYLSGNCDLMTEFRHTFLPLFAARNIEMDATCVPNQHIIGNRLYADVLVPDSPVAEGAADHR